MIRRVVSRQRRGLLRRLYTVVCIHLPRTMILACIHLWLSYAVLPETWGHQNIIATLQIMYTHNVREVGTIGVVSYCHLFLVGW